MPNCWSRAISPGTISASLFLLLFSLVTGTGTALLAQEKKSAEEKDTKPYPIKGMITIDPELMELEIEDGEMRLPGELDRVITEDTDGKRCVAKIHLEVGDNFVVMLPDGQLVGRDRSDVEATERPFVPRTHDEIADAIIEQHNLRNVRVAKTDHFVIVYNSSQTFAEVTGKVLESMLSGVIKYTREQGLDTKMPEIPLPVIAFGSNMAFQQFQPVPPGVAAYYEITTNRVILKEESGAQVLGEEHARKELLSTIAHEGCHQLLHNIGVQQRLSRWPMWLGEGIAEYMAPTKPGRKFAWKGAGKLNDMRMYELEVFLQKQYIAGFDGDTVDETVRASRLDSTHYATAWTITFQLAENHKKDFDRYMRYLSRLAPLHGMMPEDMQDPTATVDENMVHFKAFFGDDIVEFENAMVKYMAQQSQRRYESPLGIYPHYVGTAIVEGINEKKLHACFFPLEHDLAEWATILRDSLSGYDREHVKIMRHGPFQNRGEANKFIRQWKKENRPRGKRR